MCVCVCFVIFFFFFFVGVEVDFRNQPRTYTLTAASFDRVMTGGFHTPRC